MRRSRNLGAKLALLLIGASALVPLMSGAQSSGAASTPAAFTHFGGSLTAVGATVALPLSIGGYSTCSLVVSGTGSGVTATAQVASNHPENSTSATWITATTLGTSGIVSANGTYVGNIASTGLTWFRVNVSAIAGGTWTYDEVCSRALGLGSGGGGGGSVTVTNTPGVTIQNTPGFVCISGCGAGGQTFPTSSPGNAQIVVPANASAAPYTAANPLPVTTPAPGATPIAWTTASPQPVSCVIVAGVGICPTPIPTTVPTPLATASAGAAPTAAPPSIAQVQCAVPAGATPNATAGNSIAVQCQSNGAVNTNVVSGVSAPTAAPTAAAFSPTNANIVNGLNYVWNGTTWDAQTEEGTGIARVAARRGGPDVFNCSLAIASAATAQCQAAPAAGLKNYVTDIVIIGTATNAAATIQVKFGTGTNCGTGTTSIGPLFNAPTGVTVAQTGADLQTPLAPTAANAVCITSAGTTLGGIAVLLTGYIGP